MPEATVAEPPQQTSDTPQPLRQEPRFNPLDPKIRETAKALYLQGLPFPEVSATLNLRPSTVRNWAMRDNWKGLVINAKQVQQLAKGKMSVSVNVPVQSEQSSRLRSMLASEVESQAIALASVPPRPSNLPNTPERQGRAAVLKTLVDAASVIHDWDSQHTPGIIIVGETERMIAESDTPIDIDSRVEQSETPQDVVKLGDAEV